MLDIVDEIFPLEEADILRAAEFVEHRTQLSARDAAHIAIMERYGVDTILSFDADFDRWPGLTRMDQIG